MKKSVTKILLSSIGAGVITLSMAVSSWSMEKGDGPGRDPSRMLAQLSKTLELTTEQQASVEVLLTTLQEQGSADREKLGALHDTLHSLRAAFDADSAQQVADEIGEITSRMVFRMASNQADIYQLLDGEQREEMDTMMKKRAKRREKRQGFRRGLF